MFKTHYSMLKCVIDALKFSPAVTTQYISGLKVIENGYKLRGKRVESIKCPCKLQHFLKADWQSTLIIPNYRQPINQVTVPKTTLLSSIYNIEIICRYLLSQRCFLPWCLHMRMRMRMLQAKPMILGSCLSPPQGNLIAANN